MILDPESRRDGKPLRRLPAAVVLAVLAAHVALLAWGATRHSPSTDEVAHLGAGMYHWHSGRFELFPVNPPLVRLVATIPCVLRGAGTDWQSVSVNPAARSEFSVGADFIRANESRWLQLLRDARRMCLPFSVLGALVCYAWAKELYGPRAGLAALALWCFCPTVLGLAQTIMPDVHAAALGVAAGYSFWRWTKSPTLARAAVAGIALGFADLSKFTFVLFLGLGPLLWLTTILARRNVPWRTWLREAGHLAGMFGVAILLINLGYAFEGSGKPLGAIRLSSRALGGPDTAQGRNRFTGTVLGSLPVPLPEHYLQGIDIQKTDFERGDRSYLRGQWRDGGWWYYYLYALAIKVPLGTWVLVLIALALSWNYRRSWQAELALLAPVAVVLVVVSAQTGFNHHLRYVAPILPFMYVWASKATAATNCNTCKATNVIAWLALALSVVSSVSVYPHSLSYFNEAVGGPRHGPRHLLHSNIDFGQDLLHLAEWARTHPEARPLHLAFWGPLDPRIVGIEFTLPPRWNGGGETGGGLRGGPLQLRPGWYAVSVNFVMGFEGRPVFDGRGGAVNVSGPFFTYFQEFQPVTTVGYSVYLYQVTDEDVTRLQRSIGSSQIPGP